MINKSLHGNFTHLCFCKHKKSPKLGDGQFTPARGGQFIPAKWSIYSGIGVVN